MMNVCSQGHPELHPCIHSCRVSFSPNLPTLPTICAGLLEVKGSLDEKEEVSLLPAAAGAGAMPREESKEGGMEKAQ